MLVVELILDNLKFYTPKVCLDITGKLDKDIKLITDNLQKANTCSILITMTATQYPGCDMTNLSTEEAMY